MKERKRLNLDPHHPEVQKRVLEHLRTMPFEELDALMSHRDEGIEFTDMHEVLAEYDREQERKKAAEKAA